MRSNDKTSKELRYIKLPNNMTKDILKPKDCLVYLAIRSHLNKETGMCFPGIRRLSEITDMSNSAICRSIQKLIDCNYIQREEIKNGGFNYKFNEITNFEPFTYDFLYHKELDKDEKAYLACIQQFMFLDDFDDNKAKISFYTQELCNKMNLNYRTLQNIERSLISKGILQYNEGRDAKLHGNIKIIRIFSLDKIGQSLLKTIKNHEKRLTSVENKLEEQINKNKELEKEISELKEKIAQKITF